jgi:anti-anti-sigma factor
VVTDPLVSIRLLGVPLRVQAASAAHMEALQREFELIARSDGDAGTVPARLRTLIEELRARYGGMGEAQQAVMARAREAGQDTVDLTYEGPVAVADGARRLLDLLAEADEYCRAGTLITLATPPEELAFRQWFLGEFIRQVDGHEPRRWSEFRSAAPPGGGGAEPTPASAASDPGAGTEPTLGPYPNGWELDFHDGVARLAFTGELDLETAPTLREVVADVCRHDIDSVVVDLAGATFIDSVGLSVLLSTHLRLQDEGLTLGVVPSAPARRMFELAGVTGVLDLIDA